MNKLVSDIDICLKKIKQGDVKRAKCRVKRGWYTVNLDWITKKCFTEEATLGARI